jgi:hypothetical protein
MASKFNHYTFRDQKASPIYASIWNSRWCSVWVTFMLASCPNKGMMQHICVIHSKKKLCRLETS